MTQEPSRISEAIIGAWRLVSFEIDDATGPVSRPFGTDAHGSLIYTDTGHFSALVMRHDRPRFADPDQSKGTREEVDASFKGCISYYGTYRLHAEEGFVVHEVQGSMFPNWEGSEQTRFFKSHGNRMHLSTPPMQWRGGQTVAKLVWEKL